MTMQNLLPLKNILSNDIIAAEKRQMLLKSMGLSILTLHAGTWFDLTMGEYRAWQAAVMKAYQVLQKRNADGEVPHMDFFRLAMHAGAAMPLELIYLQRLRLFIHIFSNFDRHLTGSILYNHRVAGDRSWLYGVIKAVKWWQGQVGHETIPE